MRQAFLFMSAALAAGATAGLLMLPASAPAAETITYSYDARGRLVRAQSSGSVNNNVATNYVYDKADNRTNRTVTGAP
jgi:hypothetical protein